MPVKILFIASEDEENLSVRYPTAVLVNAGHSVEIAPFSVAEDTERVLKHIHRFRPDLIAVSMAFQSRAPAFFELIKKNQEKQCCLSYHGGRPLPDV